MYEVFCTRLRTCSHRAGTPLFPPISRFPDFPVSRFHHISSHYHLSDRTERNTRVPCSVVSSSGHEIMFNNFIVVVKFFQSGFKKIERSKLQDFLFQLGAFKNTDSKMSKIFEIIVAFDFCPFFLFFLVIFLKLGIQYSRKNLVPVWIDPYFRVSVSPNPPPPKRASDFFKKADSVTTTGATIDITTVQQ